MHGRGQYGTGWRKGLETAAWRMAVGMPLILIALMVASNLLAVAMLPMAATVALVPSWRLAWHSLAWDDRYGLWKVSPMLEWKEEDVWAYIKARNLPYNPLHDKGFPSIGCAPCTRAVEPGADPRSGRWWWENSESRECGLQPRRRVIPLKVEPRRAAGQ